MSALPHPAFVLWLDPEPSVAAHPAVTVGPPIDMPATSQPCAELPDRVVDPDDEVPSEAPPADESVWPSLVPKLSPIVSLCEVVVLSWYAVPPPRLVVVPRATELPRLSLSERSQTGA